MKWMIDISKLMQWMILISKLMHITYYLHFPMLSFIWSFKTDTDTFFAYFFLCKTRTVFWSNLNKGRNLSKKMQIFEKDIVVYLAKLGKICWSTVSKESHKLIWGRFLAPFRVKFAWVLYPLEFLENKILNI